MSSIFKASCAVYWIIWVIVLSYAAGTYLFEKENLHRSNVDFDYARHLIRTICYILGAFCFVGCIFVKCDVTHILCFGCYSIPLLIILPAFCILGLFRIPTTSEFNRPSDFLKMVENEWKKGGELGIEWLTNIEKAQNCCGIHSYKDYQLYIMKGNITSLPSLIDPNITIPLEVPISCCSPKVHVQGVPVHEGNHCLTTYNQSLSVNRSQQPKYSSWYMDHRLQLEQEAYGAEFNDPNFPMLRYEFEDKGIIRVNGCGEHIIKLHGEIVESHATFYIILIFCSFLMVLVFVKNWCDARRYGHDPSHHELDEDEEEEAIVYEVVIEGQEGTGGESQPQGQGKRRSSKTSVRSGSTGSKKSSSVAKKSRISGVTVYGNVAGVKSRRY